LADLVLGGKVFGNGGEVILASGKPWVSVAQWVRRKSIYGAVIRFPAIIAQAQDYVRNIDPDRDASAERT
jgi:hypothetical protein